MVGVFFAAVYIEKISTNADIERQNDVATTSQLAHLEHWVRNELGKAHRITREYMDLHRGEMKEYVVERLNEHMHLLSMQSPRFQGYSTFTPRGNSSAGSIASSSPWVKQAK